MSEPRNSKKGRIRSAALLCSAYFDSDLRYTGPLYKFGKARIRADRIVHPGGFEAACRFGEWQERIRAVYRPGLAETKEAECFEAVYSALWEKFQKQRDTNSPPRKRFLKPVARELGIEICGGHDFRHRLNHEMRRNGVDPKVRSGALGHKKVNLAMDVYDRCNLDDLEQALGSTVTQLLPSCDPNLRAA